jgi:hypothetical protein
MGDEGDVIGSCDVRDQKTDTLACREMLDVVMNCSYCTSDPASELGGECQRIPGLAPAPLLPPIANDDLAVGYSVCCLGVCGLHILM